MKSINPAMGQIMREVEAETDAQVLKKLEKAGQTFQKWRFSSFKERKERMEKLALLMRDKRETFMSLTTQEMGMPISQSSGEIEKVAKIADYYAYHAEDFLANKPTQIGAKESYVSYEPLGTLFHVAPWNFPFYLALRPIIPAIMAGNTAVLKHASNVPQIAMTLEGIFQEAGFEEGIFQTLMISSSQVESVVRDPRVSMVSVIGSEKAGQSVASTAGEELKKSVMELGGSDPFIVLRDADMNKVFPTACGSRLRNCGQSCNAAKRFIVEEEVAEEFTQKMKEAFESEVIGDPTDKNTTLGPVANKSALEGVQRQVEESVQKGAEVLTGGHGEFAKTAANWNQFQEKNNYQGYYYPPTLLTNVNKYMPVYNEEVFGPVAPIIVVQSTEEAIRVANDSPYGLGASLWTDDENKAKDLIPQIESGNVFVNSAVRSKIEMPYGGIKKSGYGREMGPEGILEFVNVKTVVLAE